MYNKFKFRAKVSKFLDLNGFDKAFDQLSQKHQDEIVGYYLLCQDPIFICEFFTDGDQEGAIPTLTAMALKGIIDKEQFCNAVGNELIKLAQSWLAPIVAQEFDDYLNYLDYRGLTT